MNALLIPRLRAQIGGNCHAGELEGTKISLESSEPFFPNSNHISIFSGAFLMKEL